MSRIVIIILASLFSLAVAAAEKTPVELQKVGIEEHLGESISLDLLFVNETGQSVPLKRYFENDRPVILTLVYYNCPNLCNYLLDGFTHTLKELSWTAGQEFNVVTVSIDPTETPALSLQKKNYRLKQYERQAAQDGWHFLTGTQNNIQTLARQVGFHYRYDEDQKEYAHSAAIFVLTPEGRISRTLYGIQFKPRDLKLALLEAAKGKIGNVVDKFLMFCYHYDPKGRKYALFAVNLMKLAGLITVFCLGILFLVILRRKNRV